MFAKNDAIYAFSSGRIKKIENLAGVKKEDKFYVFFPIRNKDNSSEYKYSADTVLVPDYCLVL